MKILIVKLSAIGDVIMSLPFLESLRQAWPEARIDWLVEEASADIVQGHPLLDRVIVSRRKTWVRDMLGGRKWQAGREIIRFIRELRRERYDLAVDLQGLFKSGILTYLSGARRRVGFDRTRELAWVFLNERLAPYDPDRHALRRYLDVATYLGGETGPEVPFHLPEDPGSVAAARDLIQDGARPLIAVNPGAKWVSKLWPLEHWRALCRLLVNAGYGLVLTGSPDEAPTNAGIAQGLPGAVDLTGRTGLRVLGEIFRQADLVICPDTGPMHLAAAVGTPVVALFGPTAPWRTGPFGDGHDVIRLGANCSPCFQKQCPHTSCMNDIVPELVFRTAQKRIHP